MARGIAARETIVADGSGAIFANKAGDEIELYDMFYFPAEGGKYEDDVKGEVETPITGRDKAVASVAQWMEGSGIKPENFTMVNAPAKAAAVSVWKDKDGELIAFGRYATQIRPGMLGINWPNTRFAKETGYSSESAVSKSENIALKPSDLFTSEPMTVPQMLTIINNLPETLPEDIREIVPAMLNAVARGEETYVPGANAHRSTIEKYVGEYAAAIALITGNFVTGNFDDVATEVLAPQGADWSDMTLAQFPTSTSQALVDSYILNEGGTARVAVSSKAGQGGGASASLASVAKILDDKADKFKTNFLAKNEDLIHGINLLAKNTAKEGVYKTGKLYKFVSDADIKIIDYLIKSFDKDEKVLTTRLKKLAAGYPSKEFVQKTMIHPNYNLGYRLLAALARKVSDKLNSLNPTELFRAVLAQSSMIQVYAKTQKRGDSLAFVEFRVVFPATFDGTIVFDAMTNYYSTNSPRGRIAFKLKS
jgi:hypothetical protein